MSRRPACSNFRSAAALVSCSFEGFGNGFYSVIGRKGVIEVPRGIILGLGTRLGEALIVTMDADGRRTEESIPPVDHYRLIVEAFADAVLNKTPVPLPPSNSLNNMRAIDAFARSAREGREVKIVSATASKQASTEIQVQRPPQSKGKAR